jgi:hypothetical protein
MPEPLEDRPVPPNFTAATVSDLIAAINAANLVGGANTITLAPTVTFELTAVNNTADGATGLPVIAGKDNLTISGQGGDILERDPAAPAFRLLDAGKGARLTLQNLTVRYGYAVGSGVSAQGVGIFNQGALRVGGCGWQTALDRMTTAWRRMDPRRYAWAGGASHVRACFARWGW